MNISDARAKLAAVLAPVDLETDPVVLETLVDSVEPPALMIGWGSPWLEHRTACLYNGRLSITAVGARLQPGAGIEQLEQLVGFALGRLHTDRTFVVESVSEIRVLNVAKVPYLAAHLSVAVPIT